MLALTEELNLAKVSQWSVGMCALPIVFIMKLVRVPASLTHGVMIHELIETIGHLSIFLWAMEPHFAWRGVGVGEQFARSAGVATAASCGQLCRS